MNTVQIAGLTIHRNIPIPRKQVYSGESHALRRAISGIDIGCSFDWHGTHIHHAYRTAKEVGRKITTRKLEEGGWRVWRTG